MANGKAENETPSRNGSVLTPEELKVVREVLISKRRELTHHQDTQLRELTTPDKHHIADLEEMASDTVDMDSYCEIIDIGTSTVEQIDNALEKMVAKWQNMQAKVAKDEAKAAKKAAKAGG